MTIRDYAMRLAESMPRGLRRRPTLLSYMPGWPGCGAEGDLKRLIKLSVAAARKETQPSLDGAWQAHRCLTSSKRARSYHSRMLIGDESPRTGSIAWLVDFARPGNFRVTQVAGNGDLDAWATIEDQHFEWLAYQLTGGGVLPGPTPRERTNALLTLDKWLSLLSTEHPAAVDAYKAYQTHFVKLTYRSDAPGDMVRGMVPSDVADYKEAVSMWMHRDTGLLMKAELEAKGRFGASDEVSSGLVIRQVFAGYGHDIRFDPAAPF